MTSTSSNVSYDSFDTGVDHHVRDGGVSYLSHLGRFLYTKNAEKVNTLSDKAWVTVAATKKLLRR